MRNFKIVLFVLNASLGFSQDSYFDSIVKHRKTHVESLFDDTNGILNKEDKTHLLKINYFPIDTNYIINAKWTKNRGRRFKMPTSTDRLPVYRRHGYLTFKLRDTMVKLTVYQNMALKKKKEFKYYFFIPFRDGTSGISSYGGGRYLDIYLIEKEDYILIDFNKSYNPYCAYSHRYSCPIPPQENTVDVQINAGEKTPFYQ